MNQFFVFVRKEFLHVLRDPRTLLVLFGLPVAQILIFGFALSGDISEAPVMILDEARDAYSERLVNRIGASRYFSLRPIAAPGEVADGFRRDEARVALVIPPRLAHGLYHQGTAPVQILTDASDPNYANTLVNYLSGIIGDFQLELNGGQHAPYRIVPHVRMLYNPGLRKELNLVPGVISLILMLVCVMMTSVSIVREKETGTLELLMVSPFRPALVIVAKTVPYLLLSLVNIVTVLAVSALVLHVRIAGSLIVLLAVSTLFIVTCLSLGILISVRVATQQVALLISLIGMLLPTILFSGFLFPIDNMPRVLQLVSNVVPAKWFYQAASDVMVKGLGWEVVWKQTAILSAMTAVFLFISFKSFKTRLL